MNFISPISSLPTLLISPPPKPNLRLLLVGEAYGANEDVLRHPFVGASGRELAYMLFQAGLAPSIDSWCSRCKMLRYFPNCNICNLRLYPSTQEMVRHWSILREQHGIAVTNVFKHHPPYNDVNHFFDNLSRDDLFMPPFAKGKYVKREWRGHVEALWEEILTLRPNLILMLGNAASWAICNRTGITTTRGYLMWSERLDVKCLPALHPAYILRDWGMRTITVADFKKAKREMEFPELRLVPRYAIIDPSLDEIKEWVSAPDITELAVDIESGYALFTKAEIDNMTDSMRLILSSQISMVGFAKSPHEALVIPFMTRNSPDLSYWKQPWQERRALNYAKQLCESNIPKIFQNGIYDVNRLAFYSIKVRNCSDDTMLMHHSIFPELRKGLGFLGSLYADVFAWKELYAQGESLKRDD